MVFSAPFIYSPAGWLTDHLIEISVDGRVLDLRGVRGDDEPEVLTGYLIPGLVNAHCHLELSFLAGNIGEGLGMAGFLRQIFESRSSFQEAEKKAAILPAMNRAWESGTQLIGDIANTHLTLEAKNQHVDLMTYTFVEVLGTHPQQASDRLAYGLGVAERFGELPHSLTLHAPYSISPALVKAFNTQSSRFSLHLLESRDERLFFKTGGPIRSLYEEKGIFIFEPKAMNPLGHVFPAFSHDTPGIWVHLTEANQAELSHLATAYPFSFFCLCPRSNVFLHQKGPDVSRFLPYVDRICLGTDSLASNHSLDLWEEVKWIHHHLPDIPLQVLVQWATTNGAKALGMEHEFGSFQVGTKPGVLHLDENLVVERIV